MKRRLEENPTLGMSLKPLETEKRSNVKGCQEWSLIVNHIHFYAGNQEE